MPRIILLDAGPLGLAAQSDRVFEARRCQAILATLWGLGHQILVPEVADYEVRRELLRGGLVAGLGRLDRLKDRFGVAAMTPEAWLRAAELWATVRRSGQPTADEAGLDGDCLLAGLAAALGQGGGQVVIATDNLRHFRRFPTIEARPLEALLPRVPPPS